MITKYKVAIIGAGKMGAFYDTPSQSEILSHAHAVTTNARFDLIGFYDLNEHKANEAAQIWRTKSFNTFEILLKQNPDVVIISAPDKYHYEYLKLLRNNSIKLIFVEKPIVTTTEELISLKGLYYGCNTKLMVNYSRRFVPEIQEIANRIQSCEFGQLLIGNAYYGKGLLHNGSHMIDLINILFNQEINVRGVINEVNDYTDEDKTISAMIEIENQGRININAVPSSAFTIFEIDLLFEQKRIKMVEGCAKIVEYSVIQDKLYDSYRILNDEKIFNTSLNNSLVNATEAIIERLDGNFKSEFAFEDGCKTLEVCLEIKKQNQQRKELKNG